jgi:hypothetical protein
MSDNFNLKTKNKVQRHRPHAILPLFPDTEDCNNLQKSHVPNVETEAKHVSISIIDSTIPTISHILKDNIHDTISGKKLNTPKALFLII